MSLPSELYWIQHLVTNRGVSGTFQLLEAWCRDTADRSTQQPQRAEQWRECARIIEEAVTLIKRVEPPLPMEDENA